MSLVEDKIKDGALVIDVRTPKEYAKGHFESATNIPVDQIHLRLQELGDKNRAIVLYCASGARSALATKIMRAAGFTDVLDAGGFSNMPLL
jgi:phage shock protein E